MVEKVFDLSSSPGCLQTGWNAFMFLVASQTSLLFEIVGECYTSSDRREAPNILRVLNNFRLIDSKIEPRSTFTADLLAKLLSGFVTESWRNVIFLDFCWDG